MSNFSFNANEVTPDEGRADAIPAGWYRLIAIASEIKPTSAGTGSYISVTFQVVDGQFQNRKIFSNFNIANPNAQAVEIGRKQFSALCHAVGILTVQATEQLHNIPFLAKVKVKPASGDYEAQNEIAQYKHNSDPSAGQPGAAVAQAPRAIPAPPSAPAFVPPPAPVAQQAWAPPVTQAAPIVQTPPVMTKEIWEAQQAELARQAQIQAAAAAVAWTPPSAAQPWANVPVTPATAAPAIAPATAQPAATQPQVLPAWMIPPTA